MAPADGSRRAPSPFTERAIRERSRDWEALDLEAPGWKLLMTDMFAIRGDAPLADLRAAGVHLEEFLKIHRRWLGGDTSDVRFSARVFRDERAFRIYAQCRGVPGAESFYDPSGAEIVMYLPADRATMGRILMHEFNHQFLDRVHDRRRPIWFVEGLAEYFGAYSLIHGSVRPGADLPTHRERLKKALAEGRLIPLRCLLAMDRDAFYDGDVMLAYAEAWSIVRLLMTRRGDVHADPIGALMRGAVLSEVVDLEEFEREWKEKLEQYP